MNDLRRLRPRAVPQPIPATHWERLMLEARENFNAGLWQKGLANVTHAAYCGAVEDDRPDPDVALRLVRDVLGVGWTPEGDAA